MATCQEFITHTAALLRCRTDLITTAITVVCGDLPAEIPDDKLSDIRNEILDRLDERFSPEEIQCPGCGQHRELVRGHRICSECG
jgi:hypothetical protein